MLALTEKTKSIFKNKEFITTSIFLIVLLVSYGFFPTIDKFQEITTPLVFFLVFPLAYNLFFTKKPLTELGFKLGDYKSGISWSLLGLFVSLLFFVFFFKYTDFLKNYSLPESIVNNFGNFLIYELIGTFFFVFLYEFFFRGYLMLFYADFIGVYAVLLQYFIFIILVYTIGSNIWVFVPFLIFTPFSAFSTYKSKSLLYGCLSQLLLIIILDSVIIHLIK